jgi:hypothetical protein
MVLNVMIYNAKIRLFSQIKRTFTSKSTTAAFLNTEVVLLFFVE